MTRWVEGQQFSCTDCGWSVRVSEEALAEARRYHGAEPTGTQLVATMEVCMQCAGSARRGERLPLSEQLRGRNSARVTYMQSRRASVYQAGGNMAGDVDWDGLPVEEGKWYVGAVDLIDGDVLVTVSAPFDSVSDAIRWAGTQGFWLVAID